MTTEQREEPQFLLLGKLLRPHGVRGEMRMSILTDYPERLAELDVVYLGTSPQQKNPKPYEIDTLRFHKQYALIKFTETTERNEADLLRGLMVMIDIANAVPLEEDEFYLYELIGLQVQTEDGAIIGTIQSVMETGANDVYVLRSPQGKEILVPAHDETLLDVDTDSGIVLMKLPDGLLSDDS
jgi:16S rRNA processing protein RimM